MSDIDSVDRLEAILGKTPPAVNLKVIDHVDESAMRWLAAAPLMFAGFGDAAIDTQRLADAGDEEQRAEAGARHRERRIVEHRERDRQYRGFGGGEAGRAARQRDRNAPRIAEPREHQRRCGEPAHRAFINMVDDLEIHRGRRFPEDRFEARDAVDVAQMRLPYQNSAVTEVLKVRGRP